MGVGQAVGICVIDKDGVQRIVLVDMGVRVISSLNIVVDAEL